MFALQLFARGGVTTIALDIDYGLLMFCSVLVVAVILERMWTFRRLGNIPRELVMRIENLITAGNWQEAIRVLDEAGTPYARIMKATLMRKQASRQEIVDVLTLASEAEVAAAARPLLILGTIGNIGPFLGLFGTVLGIMDTFLALKNNDAGLNVVGPGISIALITTAAGLAVAIIAVVSNNWTNSWVEKYRLEVERFSTEWGYRLEELHNTKPQAAAKSSVTEPVA